MSNSRMPVAFIGHGSPMNALAESDYTRALGALGRRLPRPRGILCVSAHWMTEGLWVTRMPRPRTIHDFGGFPRALFEVQYPAPGSRELAELVQTTVSIPQVDGNDAGAPDEWGLDHGAWSVLKHLYPQADVPVVQLSIAMDESARFHFDLGARLRPLRQAGILILGSGNIVHHLGRIDWNERAPPAPWALEFDQWVKSKLEDRKLDELVDLALDSEAGRLSIPTWDHWYPFLVAAGAMTDADSIDWIWESIDHGSISMRSFLASGTG
jgi:4,5-DOPA dioxygenase extradiol